MINPRKVVVKTIKNFWNEPELRLTLIFESPLDKKSNSFKVYKFDKLWMLKKLHNNLRDQIYLFEGMLNGEKIAKEEVK